MTDSQKLVWTIAFGGFYLIASNSVVCNWLTSELSDLTAVAQFLLLPLIALVIAAPGSFLVFKICKKG